MPLLQPPCNEARYRRSIASYSANLRKTRAEDAAAVLLQNIKSMRALTKELGQGVRPGALAELRIMTRYYLEKIYEDAGRPN